MPEINFFWDPLEGNMLQRRDETGAVTAEYTAAPGLYGNIISQNRGALGEPVPRRAPRARPWPSPTTTRTSTDVWLAGKRSYGEARLSFASSTF